MTKLQLVPAVLALAWGVGCNRPTPIEGPQAAIGNTTVRFVNCAVGDTNCFVSARFIDLDSCMHYKQMSDMQCVPSNSPLVVVTCKWEPGERGVATHCIK